jgi:hypothetical protein
MKSASNFSSQLRGAKRLDILINELETENSIGEGCSSPALRLCAAKPEEQARGYDRDENQGRASMRIELFRSRVS